MAETPDTGGESASPFDDMPAFLANVKRGEYMAYEIAGRRPSREDLGEQLQAVLQLLEFSIEGGRAAGIVDDIELRPADEDDLKNRYFWDPWLPLAKSPCRSDLELLSHAGWSTALLFADESEDLGRPLTLARRLFDSALDHLTGVAVLLQVEGTVRSPLALSRVALEAAARAWFLLDDTVAPSERFARSLNVEFDAMSKEITATQKAIAVEAREDDEQLRELGRALRSMMKELLALGFKTASKNKTRVEPYVGAAADLIDMLLQQSGGSTYAELSKVVHSREDDSFSLMFGVRDTSDTRHPQRDRMIAMHVLPAVLAVVEASRRLAAYTGWDFDGFFECEPFVMAAWAIGSGFRDSELEAEIVAEGWQPPLDATPEYVRQVLAAAEDEDEG